MENIVTMKIQPINLSIVCEGLSIVIVKSTTLIQKEHFYRAKPMPSHLNAPSLY